MTNFYNQSAFNDPGYTTSPDTYNYTYYHYFAKNYVLGDEIKVNDQFTILAGVNYTSLGEEDYFNGPLYGPTGGYQKGALTPTLSLIYKFLPWITTYATFQQGLVPGSMVTNSGGTIYTNNGTILPPTFSQEYEVGIKATVGTNLLLTASVFDITEADTYTQNNGNNTYTIVQSGQDVHKGIELTATGKVWDDLAVVGGFTFVDPRITNNIANPNQNGSITQGVSQFGEKIYVEYHVPYIAAADWLQGLTLIGGFHYSSEFWLNQPNTQKLPGYAVADLGVRYETKLYDHPFTIRFNVNNVANTAYWTGAGYAAGFEGPPRTFLATAQMKW